MGDSWGCQHAGRLQWKGMTMTGSRDPLDSMVRADFENALRKGFWRSIISWFSQKGNALLPYDEIRKSLPLSGEHYIGVRTILLEKIVGSVGRYRDFDRAFLPTRTTTQGRWMSIDRAHLTDVVLPPIEVYKLGEVYFVKDGNHRVSVAREKKQKYIDADVIEVDVPFNVDVDVDVDTLIREVEHLEFMERTRINELRPGVDVRLSVPGGTSRLIEHISVHRYFLGIQRKSDVTWEDAVEGWVDQVYLPMVRVIEENRILREFPGRTQADLYLWIIEHLWYLREEYKKDVSLEEAAAHFADEFTANPLHQIINMIRRTVRFMADLDSSE